MEEEEGRPITPPILLLAVITLSPAALDKLEGAEVPTWLVGTGTWRWGKAMPVGGIIPAVLPWWRG